MYELDLDRDGKVTVSDFAFMMIRKKQKKGNEDYKYEAPFKALDRNGDGKITVDDMLKCQKILQGAC